MNEDLIRMRSHWADEHLDEGCTGLLGSFQTTTHTFTVQLGLIYNSTWRKKKKIRFFFKTCIMSVTHYVLIVTSKTIKLSKLNCVIFVLIVFQILLLCLMPPSLCNSCDIPALGLCVSSTGSWQRTVWLCYSTICFETVLLFWLFIPFRFLLMFCWGVLFSIQSRFLRVAGRPTSGPGVLLSLRPLGLWIYLIYR